MNHQPFKAALSNTRVDRRGELTNDLDLIKAIGKLNKEIRWHHAQCANLRTQGLKLDFPERTYMFEEANEHDAQMREKQAKVKELNKLKNSR
jgi:hypothetical protein